MELESRQGLFWGPLLQLSVVLSVPSGNGQSRSKATTSSCHSQSTTYGPALC